MLKIFKFKSAFDFRENFLAILKSITFYNFIISSSLFLLTTKFKILNPKTDGWLSDGDGTVEIAWEFYRNTPFPHWLLGSIDTYGIEMARPAFYLLPSLYTFPARIFSSFLGDRFQIIGLIILITFFLNFYFAAKIFEKLDFTKINIILSSTLVLTSPVMLNRFIDHTHYLLTSHWIILAAFYLIIKIEKSPIKWGMLFVVSILVFPYYVVTASFLILSFIIFNFFRKVLDLIEIIKISAGVLIGIIFSSIVSGFIFFGNTIQRDTELTFKANLNSLIDPSGWSRIISDRPEQTGDYEGFGFLGVSVLILITFSVLLILKKIISREKVLLNIEFTFIVILIPSSMLAIISLSNNIYFDNNFIFGYPENYLYNFIQTNFRSVGRLIWSFVYFITLITLVFLNKNLRSRTFNVLVSLALIIGIWDMYPKLISQREQRFSLVYESPLKSSFWRELSPCYLNLVSVPPITTAEFLYPIAKIAYPQKMSIFPAAIPRVPPQEQADYMENLRNDFKMGKFDSRSIYIFQKATFVADELTALDREIAINTMDPEARAGSINGIFVIAPNFENCGILFNNYGSKLNIKKQNRFLLERNFIAFDSSAEGINNLISGWSDSESWGVWSNGPKAQLILQADRNREIKKIIISGHRFELANSEYPKMEIKINGVSKLVLDSGSTDLSQLTIELSDYEKNNNSFLIDFIFDELSTPRQEFGVEDDRQLGFALKEIKLVS